MPVIDLRPGMTSPSVLLQPSSTPVRPACTTGFTLIELLTVMSIILVLTALVIPAFKSITSAGGVTKAAYDIAGALEMARTYALANNTYVWVGFYEDDESQSSPNATATGNGGRVIVSIVASKDGTRYPDALNSVPGAFGTGNSTSTGTAANPVALTQVNKLVKIDNVHLAAVNDNDTTGTTNSPVRPPVPSAYQLGDSIGAAPNNSTGPFALTTQEPTGNVTTFTYPAPPSATRTTTSPQYTFTKIIEFDPQGEASKITENTFGGAGIQSFMEIGLQPTHGSVVDPLYAGKVQAAAAIQIEGLTGQVKIYRP